MASNVPRVQPGSFLTLHYRLAGPAGDIINTFNHQPATLSLGTGELSPAVEQRLFGLPEGAHATFEIPAGQAFGDRNADMVQWVARPLLDQLGGPDEQYQVGEVVQFPTPDGLGSYAGCVRRVATAGDDNNGASNGAGNDASNVSNVSNDVSNDVSNGVSRAGAVLIDFNHPLAGQPVTFEVHLIGVL